MSVETAYCLDEIKGFLDTNVDFSEYPYMLLLIDDEHHTGFSRLPTTYLTMYGTREHNNFHAFFRTDKNDTPIDVSVYKKEALSCLDRKVFHRWCDITSVFEIPFTTTNTSDSPLWLKYNNYIKSEDDTRGIYKKTRVHTDEHIINTYNENSELLTGFDSIDDFILLYDEDNNYSYLFDENLCNNIKSGIQRNNMLVSKLYTDGNSEFYSNTRERKFFSHVLHFKQKNVAETFLRYFRDKHMFEPLQAMTSYAKDDVNQSVRYIKSFMDDIDVDVQHIEDYQVEYILEFDAFNIKMEDAEELLVRYVFNNGLGNKSDNMRHARDNDSLLIGINDNQSLNKLKIIPSLYNNITRITINKGYYECR